VNYWEHKREKKEDGKGVGEHGILLNLEPGHYICVDNIFDEKYTSSFIFKFKCKHYIGFTF
jgi:hypothetical protein